MTGLGENSQAKTTEVFIECETRNMIEQRGDHHERDRIAERQAMIPSVCAKYLFGFVSHAVAIGDDAKPGLHIGEKGESSPIIAPVPQQRHRFADDVPSRAERRADGGRFCHKRLGACMVGISRIKTGIEE